MEPRIRCLASLVDEIPDLRAVGSVVVAQYLLVVPHRSHCLSVRNFFYRRIGGLSDYHPFDGSV